MKRLRAEKAPNWRYSLLLTVFFLLGTAAGCLYAGQTAGKMGSELSAYLKDYLSLADQHTLTASGICSMSAAYVRSPLFALLCGFSWVGTGLLPIGALLTGFFPGYAAGCLFAAFSGQGLLLALGLFGLRCFVTVTCFFLLAVPAWQSSVELFQMSFGRGHSFTAVYGHRWWLRLACVAGAICFGILLDIRLSPWLLRLLLANGI